MPVKIFKSTDIPALENEINQWLAKLERGNEVKQIHTAISQAETHSPRLFVIIQYVNALQPN